MTSDEAKKKQCRAVQPEKGTFGNVYFHGCVADECCLWVWDKKTEVNFGPVKHLALEEWQGHCGLAR